MYTAAVLTKSSREKLLQKLLYLVPEGWEVIGHHMTINMGPARKGPVAEEELDQEVSLKVVSIASNDKVMAVGVDTEVPSKNEKKHITLAVNREAGGKPKMSNQLDNWGPLTDPINLDAVVQEVG